MDNGISVMGSQEERCMDCLAEMFRLNLCCSKRDWISFMGIECKEGYAGKVFFNQSFSDDKRDWM